MNMQSRELVLLSVAAVLPILMMMLIRTRDDGSPNCGDDLRHLPRNWLDIQTWVCHFPAYGLTGIATNNPLFVVVALVVVLVYTLGQLVSIRRLETELKCKEQQKTMLQEALNEELDKARAAEKQALAVESKLRCMEQQKTMLQEALDEESAKARAAEKQALAVESKLKCMERQNQKLQEALDEESAKARQLLASTQKQVLAAFAAAVGKPESTVANMIGVEGLEDLVMLQLLQGLM